MATKARTQSATINNRQIGQICDRLSTKLRESGLLAQSVGLVLSAPGGTAIKEMVKVFRMRVEGMANMIVRHVRVNRTQTPQKMLNATSLAQHIDPDVVDAMPRGEGEEVDVYFFKPTPEEYTRPGRMSPEDLDRALDRRDLKPDPYAQAAVNKDNPAFADEHPNGTQWKDANGKWCFAVFHRKHDERRVSVFSLDFAWNDNWWFAGVRK